MRVSSPLPLLLVLLFQLLTFELAARSAVANSVQCAACAALLLRAAATKQKADRHDDDDDGAQCTDLVPTNTH